MKIDDIYEAVKARGMAVSKRRFSQNFLGRAPNYAADRGFGRCSVGALLNLYRRLGEAGQPDLQSMAFRRLLDVAPQHGGSPVVRP